MAGANFDSIYVSAPRSPVYPYSTEVGRFDCTAYLNGSHVMWMQTTVSLRGNDGHRLIYKNGPDFVTTARTSFVDIHLADLHFGVTYNYTFSGNNWTRPDDMLDQKTHAEVTGILYTVPLPTASVIGMNGSWVNRRTENSIRFYPNYEGFFYNNSVYLTTAIIRYKETSSSEWIVNTVTGDPSKNGAYTFSVTIPAYSLLEKSNYSGQIEFTLSDGVKNNPSLTANQFSFTTTDFYPVVTPLSPVNENIITDQPNLFSWNYQIGSGSLQIRAELEYSQDATTWSELAAVDGSASSVTVPAWTLPAGKIWWRARGFNTDSVPGAWSEPAAIVGYGAPPPPSISTVSNAARPMIIWQSPSQIAYEIHISKGNEIILATGEIGGADKSYFISEYLENGEYQVSLRIKNSAFIWSNWAQAIFSIEIEKPIPPDITAVPVPKGIKIQSNSDLEKLYLLRDNVPIAKLQNGSFIDYSSAGYHRYVVRGVNVQDQFADSPSIPVDIKLPSAVIALAGSPSDMIPLRFKSGERPQYNVNIEKSGSAYNYAGRKYPIYQFGEFVNETHTASYSMRDMNEWENLQRFLKSNQPVIYRDQYGNQYFASISAISATQNGFSVNFDLSLTRVDYVEKIKYDLPENINTLP